LIAGWQMIRPVSHRRFHARFRNDFPSRTGFLIALPVYMAVGVILWCWLPVLREAFRKYRYVGGMIAAALIWPFMLLQLAVIGIVFSIGWLSVNLPRLFRRKQ
jgi:hypothetical protein